MQGSRQTFLWLTRFVASTVPMSQNSCRAFRKGMVEHVATNKTGRRRKVLQSIFQKFFNLLPNRTSKVVIPGMPPGPCASEYKNRIRQMNKATGISAGGGLYRFGSLGLPPGKVGSVQAGQVVSEWVRTN